VIEPYQDLEDADELADQLFGLPHYKGAEEKDRRAALLRASDEVDIAMRYQGRKYDATQEREFPRLADEGSGRIWDVDGDGSPIVPGNVCKAVLYQADSLIEAVREGRISAIHDGLVYDQSGGLAESYKQSEATGAKTGLCRPAYQLLRKYELRTGGLA